MTAPARRPGRPSNRTHVLDAATAVALREGPGGVTIDAVVAESGLSRGGILYHFPSKESLLQALVDRDLEPVRALAQRCEPASGEERMSSAQRLRAYYDACAAWAPERGHVALAVALAENPALLRSWAQVQRDLDAVDAVDAVDSADTGEAGTALSALVARLALDGLWLSDLVDPDRFTTQQRAQVVQTLLALAEPS